MYSDLASSIDLPDEVKQMPVDSLEEYAASAYRGAWLDPADIDSVSDEYVFINPTVVSHYLMQTQYDVEGPAGAKAFSRSRDFITTQC